VWIAPHVVVPLPAVNAPLERAFAAKSSGDGPSSDHRRKRA
jgi:hypothetical protein